MNEPYVKTSIVDQTSGITSVASANGLQIGCPINSNTGPTERVTLNSLADLVRYFMPGNSFSSKDDVTIQHVGALLNSSPVDVIRVDSSTMREGIGSVGSKIYFNTNFELLEGYTNIDLSAFNEDIAPSTLWVAMEINTTRYTFFAGDGTASKFPVQYTENLVRIYGEEGDTGPVDIDTFFAKFQTCLMGLTYNTSGIINNTPNDATFVGKILAVGANTDGGYFSCTVNQYNNQLWYAELPATSGQLLSSGTSIQVGDYTLYLNTGIENTSQWINPVPIPEAPLGSGATIPASVWYGLVVDYIQNSENIQSLTGYLANTSIQVTDGAFTLDTDSLTNRIALTTTTTSYDTLGFPGEVGTVSNYRITLNYSGTNYYFGDAEGMSGFTGTILTAKTIQGIYAELYMALKKNASISDSVILTASTNCWMYYLDDIKPVTVINLMYNRVPVNYTSNYTTGALVHHLTSAENAQSWTYPGLYAMIDGTLFYTGDIEEPSGVVTRIKMSNDSCSIEEFNQLLYKNLGTVFNTYGYSNSGFLIEGDYSDAVVVPNTIIAASVRYVDQTVYPDKFAVIAAFPATSKLFKYSYFTGEEEGQYVLSLSYKGESTEYTISFDADAVDGYGNSLYYESVINSNGDINVFFRLAELSGEEVMDSYNSPAFGNAILKVDPAPADYVIALNKFGDYDNKHYNYFWDAGYASPILATAGVKLATDLNAEFVPSFPTSYRKKSQFAEYRANTAINNPRAYFLAPAQKQAALGNFNSTLAGSLSFLRAKIDLYNSGASEFAPAFGPNYGRIAVGSLVSTLGKADRESLLDDQINTITISPSGPIINFNLTAQNKHSYLDEEQFVYVSNVICHVADDYGESLIGYENSPETRMRVEVELTDRINQRIIANKNPTVTAFRVKCDDELNPTSVIESRQIKYEVWVQYTPTTAYVLATTVIKRLGSF